MDRDLDMVTAAYLECMLWADCPEERIGTVLEPSPALKAKAREDVEDFLSLLARQKVDSMGWSDIQLGHDFWLSRQGHGTGFWDRGLPAGEELHKWAKSYREVYLYEGEDKLFYCD